MTTNITYGIAFVARNPFATAEEQAANYNTHNFYYDEDGGRCGQCDCRASSMIGTYPCGEDVVREQAIFDGDQRIGTYMYWERTGEVVCDDLI